MELEQKLNIIRIIVNLSMKDGIITENEKRFINQLAFSFGIQEEEVKNVIEDLNAEIQIPKPEQDRMSIIYYMLFMLKANNDNIKASEVNYVKIIGFKLGFREELIEDMIETILSNPVEDIPPTELVNNIKKYLN